jgi:septal ring factor EnvC (AmiA/AmiB activator)
MKAKKRRNPCMKKPAPAVFALCCICLSLLPQAAWPQDFSSIDRDLAELENLIQDTLENSEAQLKQLEDLQKNLAESGELLRTYETIIAERENLLRDLQGRLSEMSEIYRRQSALSARYEKRSRFWRNFTLIAVPSAALLSGGLVWAFKK